MPSGFFCFFAPTGLNKNKSNVLRPPIKTL
jgi:hypothetical protein